MAKKKLRPLSRKENAILGGSAIGGLALGPGGIALGAIVGAISEPFFYQKARKRSF